MNIIPEVSGTLFLHLFKNESDNWGYYTSPVIGWGVTYIKTAKMFVSTPIGSGFTMLECDGHLLFKDGSVLSIGQDEFFEDADQWFDLTPKPVIG